MLSEKSISRLVCGIAAQYAKDLVGGRHWSEYRYEEYRQELFLEAYKLLKANKDLGESYLATCLWNRAGEVYRVEKRIQAHEFPTDMYEDDDNAGNTEDQVRKTFWKESVIKSNINADNDRLTDVVSRVLELTEMQDNEDIKTFIIAKLKLCGYLPLSMYPEVEVNQQEYIEADITENHKILLDFFNMNSAFSGGTNKFKNSKRRLFLDLISEFDIEDMFKRRFEVKYLDITGTEKIEFIKKYSELDVKRYFASKPEVKTILSIALEE